MRLFTGIAIDPAVLENMGTLLDELRSSAQLNWSKAENLHITTKFIGEWPEARLGELENALAGVEKRGEFPVTVRGLGFFPSATRPRVFFAGVEAGAPLHDLAARIESACEGVGCAREERDYSPHLTLAKIRNAKVESLRERIAPLMNKDWGAFTAREFHLYLSTPSGGGSVYRKLASFPLA